MLLWDLENEYYKKRAVYAYIESNKDKAPLALYGTSGAGKTRSVLEYLSHNKGLYFLAANSDRDPGSLDLYAALSKSNVKSILDKESGRALSNSNQEEIERSLRIVLYVRYAVYEKVAQLLQGLTPFEWLLLQLYPKQFLGDDLFRTVTHALLHIGHKHERAAANILSSIPRLDRNQQSQPNG